MAKSNTQVYLEQIIKAHYEIKRLEELIEGINDIEAYNYSSEKVQTSNVSSDTEKKVMQRVKYIDKLSEEIENLKKLIEQISEQIKQVEDERYRCVLQNRYVLCKQFKVIADEMNYSISNIFKLHDEALTAFQEILDKECSKV